MIIFIILFAILILAIIRIFLVYYRDGKDKEKFILSMSITIIGGFISLLFIFLKSSSSLIFVNSKERRYEKKIESAASEEELKYLYKELYFTWNLAMVQEWDRIHKLYLDSAKYDEYNKEQEEWQKSTEEELKRFEKDSCEYYSAYTEALKDRTDILRTYIPWYIDLIPIRIDQLMDFPQNEPVSLENSEEPVDMPTPVSPPMDTPTPIPTDTPTPIPTDTPTPIPTDTPTPIPTDTPTPIPTDTPIPTPTDTPTPTPELVTDEYACHYLSEIMTGNIVLPDDFVLLDYVKTSDGFVFPNSDHEYLNEEDLIPLNRWELYVARNEIYARHGKTFSTIELNAYFNHWSWYAEVDSQKVEPRNFQESVFNNCEEVNIDTIKKYELSLGYKYQNPDENGTCPHLYN